MRLWKNTENAGTSLNAMPRVVVSLTSHTRERLAMLPYFLYRSILQYRLDYAQIVLTLYKDDLQYIPDRLRDLVDVGLVELITAPVNLRCHLKYFYAMKKYRDVPIITIDDDSVYPPQMIPDLLAAMEKYPGCIIGRSGCLLDVNKTYTQNFCINSGVDNISKWNGHADEPRMDLNVEGYGGILYPPDILKVSDDYIPEILETPRADDIYLMVIENRLKVNRVVPYYPYPKLLVCTKGFDAISTKRDNVLMIDSVVQHFKGDLVSIP